jgi:twinkle protein
MSVYQVMKLPTLSLPFGASNFPYQLLDILKDYEKVYLWMDFDQMGQMNVENFA